MRFRKLSPLQACGCYLAVIVLNIAWGALIFGIVKLVRWAWGG